MPDSSPATPLTDQTLKRLRALANGNGIEPDSITLLLGDEQTYALEGMMMLAPFCDVENKQYAGPAGAKNVKIMASVEALQDEIGRRKQALNQRTDWIEEVKKELHDSPGQGWGLDGAKVVLPGRSTVLAASAPCPGCQGNKTITCAQCQGRGFSPCVQCRGQRQEFCYNCAGSGQNPQNRNEPCVICRGTRYIPCRLCRATGQMPCPTCGGRRGLPCPACRGAGQITEEAHLHVGATTHFHLKGGVLPSGLRRGLDRLGIVNLSKGHADIEIVTPREEKEEEIPTEDNLKPGPKPAAPMLSYIAHLPFADLRIDFGGRKAEIGAFGKRGIPLDVPPFLDEPLKPWREKLTQAAKGRATIEDAIKARALHDALMLELQGKGGNVKELRRLYPVGLSAAAAEDIVGHMRKAVKRATLLIRVVMAVLCGFLSAGFFTGYFFTWFPASLAQRSKGLGFALDLAPLVLMTGLSWAVLYAAMRFVLRRRFPDIPVAMKQTAGTTGIAMTLGILLIGVILFILSPLRPAWLPLIH